MQCTFATLEMPIVSCVVVFSHSLGCTRDRIRQDFPDQLARERQQNTAHGYGDAGCPSHPPSPIRTMLHL